ncbi:MAG: ribosome-associated translation inhibitor RaiA [Bacteroidales bacterium]|jgi:putative sigma-54 modulation protein|nr:ribosome-associated translation inhibitor RaiA [Bacteroidales bacterium]
MNIKINSIKFSPSKQLETFVEGKVKKLGHFYDDIIGAEIFLKLENSQKIKNKVTEIKLDLPGNELFAKKHSKSFEESTDNAIDALRKQIIKHKNKRKRA